MRESARGSECERDTHRHTRTPTERLSTCVNAFVRAGGRAGGYRRAICVVVMGLGTVLVSLITAVATGFLTFDHGQHQLFIVAHVLLSPPPPLSLLSHFSVSPLLSFPSLCLSWDQSIYFCVRASGQLNPKPYTLYPPNPPLSPAPLDVGACLLLWQCVCVCVCVCLSIESECV
jgi:hypothetical protein